MKETKKELANKSHICYIVKYKERAIAKVVDQMNKIAMPPFTRQSIRVAFAMYAYLQNVKINVSNAKRNKPNDIRSLKSKPDENITPPKTDGDAADNNGGESTGGSTEGDNTGGSTGGGNTGGSPEVSEYKADERFAEGYLKMELDKEKGTLTVAYKLKEAR